MGLKPLGIVKEAVESAGMAISYAYDDLVFIDHNAFLLQFTDKDNECLIHINFDADENKLKDDISRIKKEAFARDLFILSGRYYRLHQDGDENIRLEFINAK